jgi:hypothetical protein
VRFHLYGLMMTMELFMISPRKEPYHPQNACQQQAQKDTGDHGEVEPESFTFDTDVASQLSEAGDMGSQQPDRTDSG